MARHLTPEQHEQRMALYRQGNSDRGMGKILGVNKAAITTWRHHWRLAPNGTQTLNCTTAENEQRLTLYWAGAVDKVMAEACRVTKDSIRRWRKVRNLPSNGAASALTSEQNEERAEIARTSLTIDEFATRAGRSRNALIAWQQRHGHVLHNKRARSDGEIESCAHYSLDALTFLGRESFLDRLKDERSSSWLEEMGATVW